MKNTRIAGEYTTGRESLLGPPADPPFAETSFHGLVRTIERTGKDAARSVLLVRKAWKKGKTVNDHSRPKLRAGKGPEEEPLAERRIYKGDMFIFSPDGTLITMYPLTEDYYHKTVYDGKIRIRKAKQYHRMYRAAS